MELVMVAKVQCRKATGRNRGKRNGVGGGDEWWGRWYTGGGGGG